MSKNAFTAGGGPHKVARILAVADGLRRIGEFESAEMLTAYAERIKADEGAEAVAFVDENVRLQFLASYTEQYGHPEIGTKLFVHPPAQAAQVDALPDPLGCNDCTHPDCGRYNGPRSVECRAMLNNACARPAGNQPYRAPTAEPAAQGDRVQCEPLFNVPPAQPAERVAEGWTRAQAKLHERKTVHEWLNDLHIEREEFGKPLCLLRRLRILCDRYADTCEQLSFEIRKQSGWISTSVSQPERNAMAIYWHTSEHGGFPSIADEWRDEHHLASASHWLPYQAPVAAAPSPGESE